MNVTVRGHLPDHRYGNFEDALGGRYDIDIGALIGEGWHRTKGLKTITLLGGFAVFVMTSCVGAMLVFALGLYDAVEPPGMLTQLVWQLAFAAVIFPFLVGFLMTGIRQAAELPVNLGTPFSYFAYTVPVVIASVVMSLLTTLGFFALFVPGLYLSVAYLFALPLIIDRGLGPWAALEASRKAVTARWFKIFALILVLMLMIAVGFLTVIGWIWTVPLWFATYGVLYRSIFGVVAERVETTP